MVEHTKISQHYRKQRSSRQVMCGQMIPRHIHKEIKQSTGKKLVPTKIPNAALLTLNVVDFTFLSSDGTPEQLTSILNKLFDMVDNRLENYENLFKVNQ